jgi:hypothetical protein
MRLRLGLLQNAATIDRIAAKEAKEAAEAHAKKRRAEIPTVKTEAQTKADEAAAAKEKSSSGEKSKTSSTANPRIRPLSEAKAIDFGANFISEAFLFAVAGSLIVYESFRSRRKENSRREDVAVRISELEENEKKALRALVALEKEIVHLKGQRDRDIAKSELAQILSLEGLEGCEEEDVKKRGWLLWLRSLIMREKPSEEPPPPKASRGDINPGTTNNAQTSSVPKERANAETKPKA